MCAQCFSFQVFHDSIFACGDDPAGVGGHTLVIPRIPKRNGPAEGVANSLKVTRST